MRRLLILVSNRVSVENTEFSKILYVVNELRREYNLNGGAHSHRLSKRIQNVQLTDVSPRVLFSVSHSGRKMMQSLTFVNSTKGWQALDTRSKHLECFLILEVIGSGCDQGLVLPLLVLRRTII